MRKILEACPTCGHTEFVIRRIDCPQCGTEVRGAFVASRFCRLSESSLEFLEMFVRNRGNLKEMERELKTSYTALRNQLNDVIQEMGYELSPESSPPPPTSERKSPTTGDGRAARRQTILERLERGELTPDDAIEQLRRL